MRWIPFIVVGFITVFLAGAWFGASGEAERFEARQVMQETLQTTIAVVNADTGVIVDGTRQNFSAAIIDTLGADFVLVSPEMARTGYESGIYGAIITFPRYVSERILSFNALEPERVQLEFVINVDLPENDFIEVYRRILEVQTSINTTLAQTYVTEIFEQFHTAQDQVDNVIQNSLDSLAASANVQMERFTAEVDLGEMPRIAFEPRVFEITPRAVIEAQAMEQIIVEQPHMFLDAFQTISRDPMQGRLRTLQNKFEFSLPAESRPFVPSARTKLPPGYEDELTNYINYVLAYQNEARRWHENATRWHDDLAEHSQNMATVHNYLNDWHRALTSWQEENQAYLNQAGTYFDEVRQLHVSLTNLYQRMSSAGEPQGYMEELASLVSSINELPPFPNIRATTVPRYAGAGATVNLGILPGVQTGADLGLPGRPEDFWTSLNQMHDQLRGLNVDTNLITEYQRHVQMQLLEYERYLDSIRHELANWVNENIMMMAEIHQHYAEYVMELQMSVLQAEANAMERLNNTITTFANEQERISNDTQNRLLSFANMMPESRTPLGINENLVSFTVMPLEIVTPDQREATIFEIVEAFIADTFWEYLLIAIPVSLVVFLLTLLSYLWRRKSKKVAPSAAQILIFVVLIAIWIIPAQSVFANTDVNVTIENERVEFEDQRPVIVDGRTLVPVRGVFEELGFEVEWNDATRQAILTSDHHTVVLTVGSNIFVTNGVNHNLDVYVQVIGGRTMLPIRAVLESVGYFVYWDARTRTVQISAEPIGEIPDYVLIGDLWFSTSATFINLKERNLTSADIVPLRYMSNLSELQLYGNQISDLTPLTRLTTLAKLDLENNNISDLAPLARLTNLTGLWLDNNRISDLEPLSGLGNLAELTLSGNQVFNLESLADLRRLEVLWLDNNHISNIEPLENLRSLRHLMLNNNRISNLEPLSGLTSITHLELNGNNISNLEPLSELGRLNVLLLDYNRISDLESLADLRRLEVLWLDSNQISDLEPLARLTNLTELWLYGNEIYDLTPLTGLTRLTMLGLENNQIYDLAPLSRLTNLTHLGLNDNHISELTPLAGLIRLEVLHLDDNLLVDLATLARLTRLEVLWLDNNQISNLAPLSTLRNLRELWLQNNRVTEWSYVDHVETVHGRP